ncbi:MAG TPA: hypothetical protein VKP88_04940 [Candidatus Paceibacterota bacterium]|nr:hypothetical protein [Candidatus Paceibacterota bacterium]
MNEWTDVIQYSFQTIWVEFISVLPQIVVALLVLIIGWIVAGILKSVVQKVFAKLHVDKALDAAGVDTLAQKAGYTLNSGTFVGTLVKWFVIIVFFVAALDILNLQQATAFLSSVVLGYLPQVIVAVLILFGGLILASFAKKMVVAGVKASSLGSPELLGKFSYYAIVLFTIIAALNQLAIAPEMMQMLFAGLVFGLSLAFGLAFGFGGRDAAARYLSDITKNGGGQGGGHSSHHHG